MKHKFLPLIASALCAISLSACGKDKDKDKDKDQPGETVYTYEDFDFRGPGYLDLDYCATKHLVNNLAVGETKQIEVETFPTSYASSSLTYKSSNENIVSVDASGKLTGKAKGVADVEIKAKDGSVQKTRVVVSSASTKDASKTAIDNITSAYTTASKPTKVARFEYSYEKYLHEGVLDHGMESYEAMGFDAEEGYFFVEGPSLYYKTKGGTPELSDGKWIMYTMNDGLMTRLVHITPTSKNYFDMNTANYTSLDRIIKDIINFFFVSGEKIINDLMDDYYGKDNFEDATGYSGTKYYDVDSNSLMMNLVEHGENQVVEYDDELNYYDIPTDTVYSYDFSEYLLNHENRTKSMEVDMSMYYKLGTENWTRTFYRSQLFESDFEHIRIDNPKDSGFKLVDSIYDL